MILRAGHFVRNIRMQKPTYSPINPGSRVARDKGRVAAGDVVTTIPLMRLDLKIQL